MISPQKKAEIMMAHVLLEQRTLELIYERFFATAPPNPNELGEPASERYLGYYEGYFDAIEALKNIIDNYNEDNEYRV